MDKYQQLLLLENIWRRKEILSKYISGPNIISNDNKQLKFQPGPKRSNNSTVQPSSARAHRCQSPDSLAVCRFSGFWSTIFYLGGQGNHYDTEKNSFKTQQYTWFPGPRFSKNLSPQLDVALEELETQRNGLVFIYNMSNSKYSNFDYELSQKMLTLLKGKSLILRFSSWKLQ